MHIKVKTLAYSATPLPVSFFYVALKKVSHKVPKQLSACIYSTFMCIIYVGFYFHLLYMHIGSGYFLRYMKFACCLSCPDLPWHKKC